jgi:hypothetical protein
LDRSCGDPLLGAGLIEPMLHLATHGIPAAAASVARVAANPLLARVVAPSERSNLALGSMLFDPALRGPTLNMLTRPAPPPLRNMLMGWPGQQAALAVTAPSRARAQGAR